MRLGCCQVLFEVLAFGHTDRFVDLFQGIIERKKDLFFLLFGRQAVFQELVDEVCCVEIVEM